MASTSSHEAGIAISMASAATAITRLSVAANDDGFPFVLGGLGRGFWALGALVSGGRISKETSSTVLGPLVPGSLSDGVMVFGSWSLGRWRPSALRRRSCVAGLEFERPVI